MSVTPEQRQRQATAAGRAAIRARWDTKQQRPAPTAREVFQRALAAVLAAPAKPAPPPERAAAPAPAPSAKLARRVQVPCRCGACPYCGAEPARPGCRSHGAWRSRSERCTGCEHPVAFL